MTEPVVGHYAFLVVGLLALASVALVFYLDRRDTREKAGKLDPSSSPR